MKKIIPFLLTLTLVISSFGQVQDNRTLETKIADILAQMPAQDIAYRDRLVTELISLEDKGFSELAAMLQIPGTGDDSSVRMAINSMARYASQKGHEKERAFIEGNLLTSIASVKEKAIQRFLIHQLNLTGSDRSVKTLRPFLVDEVLCEPATQALLSIRTESAKQALLEMLPRADSKNRITLVKALGELQYTPAVPAILQFEGSKNPTLQRVTLQALANIGDPAAYKTLLKAATLNLVPYEPTMAVSSFVNYLDRLGENGELELCRKGISALMNKCITDSLLHFRASLLNVYTAHFGEKVLPLLLKEAGNKSIAYRNAVLDIAKGIGGTSDTKRWILLAKKSDPAIRADILCMLGRRGDKAAVSFVEGQLSDKNSAVRTEALGALAALEGKDAVPVLLNHLGGGKDITATEKILLTFVSKEDLHAVAETAKTSSGGETKAACLRIIAARGGVSWFPMIRDLCASDDKTVQDAAFRALQGVASADDLNDLIGLLLKTDDTTYVAEVQQAIVAAIKSSDNQQEAIHQLNSILKKTDNKERIIEILPSVGGKEALKSVADIFNTSEGNIRQAAFRALVQWNDPVVAGVLYTICKNGPLPFHPAAFAGFVRQIEHSGYPEDQKLLQFRKIMLYAGTLKEKLTVIRALGELHTFPTLVYLGRYLDDSVLQGEAALSIMSVALPATAGNPGLNGRIVRELLTRTLDHLSGQESDYQKEKIRHYLETMPQEEGFVSMFNGKDLSGWKGFVADPLRLAKMSKRELKKKQTEADRKMHENWSVNENSIVFNGKGNNLVSEKIYGNFEMWVDWRITRGGDSGIYLRGSPQVQIWDTSRTNVGAQVGSGGLYNNKRHRSTPLKVADNPVGDWNTFHITMTDSIVTVYLNGELVVDHVPLENYWDRTQPIFPAGPVELQAHGTNLAFRDIYIREIPDNEYNLSPEERAAGFRALFNGKNLDGWVGNKTDYHVENGMIVIRPQEGSHGNLYTEKEYSNFIFRFEFRLTPAANNGVGIRAPLKGDAAYAGMEIQILDNTAPVYAHLRPYQYHGSVYGVIPAKRGYLKPVGEWNSEEIIANGSKIKVTLNSTVIVDGDIKEASRNGTMDHKNHPGLLRGKGHIGFLGHGSVVWFRNIRVYDL